MVLAGTLHSDLQAQHQLISSGSEKRSCGLFAALESHKEAGGNEGRRLGGLNPCDGHFSEPISGL